jgi:hypothetical protein
MLYYLLMYYRHLPRYIGPMYIGTSTLAITKIHTYVGTCRITNLQTYQHMYLSVFMHMAYLPVCVVGYLGYSIGHH